MRIDILSRVCVLLLDRTGRVVNKYWTKNFLTELGEAYLADRLSDRNAGDGDIDNMAIGTGSGQSRTSTTLATEVARVNGASFTVAQGTGADDNDVIWQGTFGTGVPGTDQTISEGALFSAAAAGTMINYFELQPAVYKPTTLSLVVQVYWTIGAS